MKNRSAEQGNRIRVPFRIALSTILVILLLGTVAGIGILSYSNLRKNADGLSSQVLDQTSLRIEMWVGNLLSRALDQSQLNRATLGQVRLSPKTFNWLGSYWRRVMESQPYFTFLSVGLETGGMLSIERLQDGRLVFREVRLNRNNDTLEVIDYRPEDFRERKAYNRKIVQRRTNRMPSWYLQARDAGRPVWTEARTIRKGIETFVVGDHVNTASRFEGLNRHYGTQIMIGPGTYDLVKDRFVARPLDLVSVKGRKGGIRVYELMGDRKTAGEKQVRIAEWTTVALDAYLEKRWDEAIENYEKVLRLDPGDPPAALMLARSRECVASSPHSLQSRFV